MSTFTPVNKLSVFRRLSSGEKVRVGVLAQNTQAVFFQYEQDYLQKHHSLSPFQLPFDEGLHQAPKTPHQGLHGVFSDSLPDGWGLLLMDRVLRRRGLLPQQLTAMDRLSYVGSRGMGALTFEPSSDFLTTTEDSWIDIARLGEEAGLLFEGQTDIVLAQLANAGSSGGARPKAQIYVQPDDLQRASTVSQTGLVPWLVKFTSSSLALGHEEGLCEAAYLTMAKNAGIDVPEWALIPAPESSHAIAWLALRRFDCNPEQPEAGRYHLHSLCGLLDADFRTPSVDYEDLIKASQILCKSPAEGQVMFARAMFNLFALNQDDHSKNWSFIMDDKGNWKPSPFYDVTFCPNPHNEHTTAFGGYGKAPPLKVIQQLALQANFSSWKQAQQCIEQVVDAVQTWNDVAKELEIHTDTRRLIAGSLNSVWQQNKVLLSGYNPKGLS